MERYDHIGVVGAGSYGVVMKCRHRSSDQIVAIKKFLETEDDATIRKMAIREIRMLKKLRHENLVTLIEVFRYRKRFYLVFEYMSGTVLDEIEKHRGGIGKEKTREHIFQVLRALAYCHSQHIVHRDIKPENILISSKGVVKVCDFGFARVMSYTMELCTEYVATRWYRAPELLVGEQQYGAGIDVWATGCLFAEMLNGEALFPGESDIDQLYLIVKAVGKPCNRHQAMMAKNSQLRGMINCSVVPDYDGLQRPCHGWSALSIEFLISFLQMDPKMRPGCSSLLNHKFFTHDNFAGRFLPTLRHAVITEFSANPLLRKFKSEVLLSSDMQKLGETFQAKLSSHSSVSTPPWRVNIADGAAAKRKFSCDNPDLHLTGHRSFLEKTGITFLKSIKNNMHEPSGDISTLRQSIKNMSATPDNDDRSECTDTTSSSYTTATAKLRRKSPTVLQNASQPSLKSIFSQQLANISSTELHTTINAAKKVDRYSMSNMFIQIDPLHNALSVQVNSPTTNQKKTKVKNDFTLPNLPGATTSPKEQNRNNIAQDSYASIITPRILSASGSPKHILPLM